MGRALPQTPASAGDDLADGRGALAGWRAELIQLGRGASRARLTQHTSGRATVSYVEVSTHFVMRLTALRGGQSLILSDAGAEPIRTAGVPLVEGRFLALQKRESADLYLPAYSSFYLVNLRSHKDLAIRATPSSGSRVPYLRSTSGAVAQRALRELRSFLNHADVLGDSPFATGETICLTLRALLTRSELSEVAAGAVVRHTAVDRARALIDAHPERSLKLADLCRATGARPRTIEYGFREFFDTTPMGYIRSVRLTRVRRQLLRAAGNPCSISATARRWGFVHMGQFDTHYRLLFGETPSMTLEHSRVRAQTQPLPQFAPARGA
jgi:AraC family ethanolamine operon transcriptional activator